MKPNAKRLSRILHRLFLIGMYAAPALTAAIFWNLEWVMSLPGANIAPGLRPEQIAPGGLTPGIKVLGFLAAMVTTGLTCALFWNLAQLFRCYAREEVFTAHNVRRIRTAGMLLLVREILTPIQGAALSIILTLNNPPGERMVTLGLQDSNLTGIVTALTVVVAAYVMDQARELQEDAQLTI